MGVALAKRVFIVTVKEEQGYAIFAVQFAVAKCPLTSYTVLTRRSASV